MTVIIDYGVGNLFSLQSSLASIGAEAKVSADPDEILAADRIILPGVGAFADAAEKLRKSGLVETLIAAKKEGVPIMGICLGMQLLFEKSYEYGCHDGLGFLKGDIVAITEVLKSTEKAEVTGNTSVTEICENRKYKSEAPLKIPHMGWNALQFTGSHPLFKYIGDGDFVYFVHSYCAVNTDAVIAATEYGADLTAAVAKGNVMGCQFHPEKSGKTGLKILKAFCEMKKNALQNSKASAQANMKTKAELNMDPDTRQNPDPVTRPNADPITKPVADPDAEPGEEHKTERGTVC